VAVQVRPSVPYKSYYAFMTYAFMTPPSWST